MKVLIVTSSIDPSSGGPTRSCKGLCRALSQAGIDTSLLVLHGTHPFENPCGVKVVYAEDNSRVETEKCRKDGPGETSKTQTISNLKSNNSFDLHGYDLVHLQGLWNPGLHKIAISCRKAHIPYVISPRGMLDPWALSVKKWKKRLALFLYQRNDLKHAAVFHATADLEATNIRAQGLTQPIIISPNGVELPDFINSHKEHKDFLMLPAQEESQNQTISNLKSNNSCVAIFLSRLHPGKGLLTLAEAWARVKPQNWIMRVVGPDSYGHKAEVTARLDALGIPWRNVSRVEMEKCRKEGSGDSSPDINSPFLPFSTANNTEWQFRDMVDDKEKWLEYANADLLIHPSVSENFGITIAEGLAAGLPVICTKGTPWKDIETYNCGWWIDQGVDALESALREATSNSKLQTSNSLSQMGANGRALIESKYTWPAAAKAMIAGYRDILSSRDPYSPYYNNNEA